MLNRNGNSNTIAAAIARNHTAQIHSVFLTTSSTRQYSFTIGVNQLEHGSASA